MNAIQYKNVIFDIGNVIVVWSPIEIVRRTFGTECDVDELINRIFHTELWKQLNLGFISEEEAKTGYRKGLDFTQDQVDALFFHIKDTQDLISGTVALIKKLRSAGFRIYVLSDNVNGIVHHLKKRYDFWKYLEGGVISSEVHLLKPDPEIYRILLDTYGLNVTESVFIDDTPRNTWGARDLGLAAIDFASADQCETELKSLGFRF